MPLNLYKERRPSRVLAIAAGKGGVGKSTVTVQLAKALQSLGRQVGILDADLYGPSIRHMLPEQILPRKQGEKYLPAVASGISVMSMAYFRGDNESTVVRAPIANQLVRQFLENVLWGGVDWLLIDYPPGTGDIPLTLSQHSHLTGALMVTTPQEVALLDVRKAIRLFQQVDVPVIGIVENMSSYAGLYPFGRGGGERLAKEYGVPLFGEVPLDPEFRETEPIFQNIAARLIKEYPI